VAKVGRKTKAKKITKEQLLAEFMKPDEVAKMVGLTIGTLRNMRCRGAGPPYHKFSARSVRYNVGDIKLWMDNRRIVPRYPHRA